MATHPAVSISRTGDAGNVSARLQQGSQPRRDYCQRTYCPRDQHTFLFAEQGLIQAKGKFTPCSLST